MYKLRAKPRVIPPLQMPERLHLPFLRFAPPCGSLLMIGFEEYGLPEPTRSMVNHLAHGLCQGEDVQRLICPVFGEIYIRPQSPRYGASRY